MSLVAHEHPSTSVSKVSTRKKTPKFSKASQTLAKFVNPWQSALKPSWEEVVQSEFPIDAHGFLYKVLSRIHGSTPVQEKKPPRTLKRTRPIVPASLVANETSSIRRRSFSGRRPSISFERGRPSFSFERRPSIKKDEPQILEESSFSKEPAALDDTIEEDDDEDEAQVPLPEVMQPSWGTDAKPPWAVSTDKSLRVTWLGHATALIQFPSVDSSQLQGGMAYFETYFSQPSSEALRPFTILVDPIFSHRAGPNKFIGPSRIVEAPCSVDDLPQVDIVCISHNHYDHLDTASVVAVAKRFPKAQFFVPLGVKSWFSSCGITNVSEHTWYDEPSQVSLADGVLVNEPAHVSLRITCVPAQHNSGRTLTDSGKTLWCGWVFEQFVSLGEVHPALRVGSVYFAGDTGYRRHFSSTVACPAYEEIGSHFGPFDAALVPIWRGGTLSFVSWLGFRLSERSIVPCYNHATPPDAVRIHREVHSKNTIAIHFATFVGSLDETRESLEGLRDALAEHGVVGLAEPFPADNHGRMGFLNFGQTWVGKPTIEAIEDIGRK